MAPLIRNSFAEGEETDIVCKTKNLYSGLLLNIPT